METLPLAVSCVRQLEVFSPEAYWGQLTSHDWGWEGVPDVVSVMSPPGSSKSPKAPSLREVLLIMD